MIGEKISLKLSERVTVVVGELDGSELGRADLVLGEAMRPLIGATMETTNPGIAFAMSRTYAICSIRSINGEDVAPFTNLAEYHGVAQRLGKREIDVLQEWANPTYSPDAVTVGNEQNPPSSA